MVEMSSPPKATYAADKVFGTQSEIQNKSKIEGVFKRKLIHRGGWKCFDYDDGATFFVELKTRRATYDQYPDTPIGANKVDIAEANPNRTYWICYAFQDGIYGIQYSKEVFAPFERRMYSRGARADYNNQPQECVFIPNDLMTKLT